MSAFLFLAAHLVLPLFGAAAAWHPSLRRAPLALRGSGAFLGGAVVLTLEGMLWSVLGVRWTVTSLGLPAVVLSSGLAWFWARQPAAAWRREPCRPAVAVAGLAATAGGLLQLAVAAVSGRAASVDLVLFWGVKASHWAAAGGLDAPALADAFAIHTHPSYPPLFSTVLAWGALVAGELPWLAVPATSVLWVAATVPVVLHPLGQRVGGEHALAVTGFWTVGVTAALVAGCCAGNAEPPLVAFTTAAVVAALVGVVAGDRRFDGVAAVAAAGAVLSKNEGAVAVASIVAGLLMVALWRRESPPLRRALPLVAGAAAAFLGWVGVRLALGLPLTDPIRERAFAISFDHLGTILGSVPGHLGAGTRGLAWLVPLALLLVVGRRRLGELLPALGLAAGLIAFLGLYYLHAEGDPARLISWTLPRVTVPALSALILAAGMGTGPLDPLRSDPTGRELELEADR